MESEKHNFAEIHNQFPEIISILEQADKLEGVLRGLLGAIKYHETRYFIDHNYFDQTDAANSALSSLAMQAIGDADYN